MDRRTRAWPLYRFLAVALFLAASSSLPAAETSTCENWVARIASVQGVVEIRSAGRSDWRAAQFNDIYCPGDTLRVQARSRAAVLLRSETVVRLDQNTTLSFADLETPPMSWLELVKGAAHFISRVPRTLKIKTPFVNAAVEGTEFVLRITAEQALLTVYEGRVLASNDAGSLAVGTGQSAVVEGTQGPALRVLVRPRDAVQWALYYPPVAYLRAEQFADLPEAERAVAAYRTGDTPGAIEALRRGTSPRALTLRASLLLSVGRVDDADTDLDRVLAIAPQDSDALALKSLIAVVKNEKDAAFELARRAIDAAPQSSMALLSLSYAQQAAFDLNAARAAAERAVQHDPANALARARLAELWLAAGDLDKALNAAGEAVARDPNLARTQTVLGFAYLTQIKTTEAKAVFQNAIVLDQADPLPRLGFGLAKIREGDLDGGRREIEIAASLDPGNALVRSYLGKAYYEERRDRLAGDQLEMAKQLDPHDPTPWFYDAIRKQAENRPVEALQDLQKSIALNDNRAVYRSRLLLDQDAAARSASRARTYNELGFQQLAVHEAAAALSMDPGNSSAHRFLAESYGGTRRHEIGRASEALQSQLLQPLTLTPVPPELAETNLLAFNAAGPAFAGFNEYTPLYVRDGHAASLTAGGGSNSTAFDEALVAGLQGRLAYSFGQYHYDTDGFRPNNDLKQDIYNAFFQYAATPATHLQLELRSREQRNGDLRMQFDPFTFSPTSRQERDEETLRLGYRQATSPTSTFIASLIYRQLDALTTNTLSPGRLINIDDDTDGYNAETQYLFGARARHILGGGYYKNDTRSQTLITARPPASAAVLTYHRNAYLYSLYSLTPAVRATVGASLEDFDASLGLHRDRINPKLGLEWDVTERAQLRLAGFRTLKRSLVSNQTLEPTQVAGFSQFFDDINGTTATRYGLGLDYQPSPALFVGLETSLRRLEVPFLSPTRITLEDETERLHRAYLAWPFAPRWALGVEYLVEEFEKDRQLPTPTRPQRLETRSLPVGISYHHPHGPFARLRVTAYEQDIVQTPTPTTETQATDEFELVDLQLGYRFPRRRGLVSLDVRNLFDKRFNFHDTEFQTGIAREPIVRPERTAILRLTLFWD